MLILILCLISSNVIASNFYFTDTYGNKVENIYSNTNNYLSLNKKYNDSLSIIDIKCYNSNTSCSYNKEINELQIYTSLIAFKKLFVYVINRGKVDSIQLQIIQPFYNLKINISSESLDEDTLNLTYGKSVFVELEIEDNYKYLTKFEENIYLLSAIFWDKDQYPVIVKKHSYNKYELLFPYSIFGYKFMINTPVYLFIYPHSLVRKNEPEPILHRSVNYIVKIE